MKRICILLLSSIMALTLISQKGKNCMIWRDNDEKNTIISYDESTFYYIGEIGIEGDDRLFYLSKCDSLRFIQDKISFVLNEFIVSSIPFSLNEINKEKSDESIVLPFELTRSISFKGEVQQEKLILHKFSDYYDSRSDKIVLYCKE